MKIAIIGSRNCGDLTVEHIIPYIPEDTTTIVSGGATGVDALARLCSQILGLTLEEFLPDYNYFGKQATIVRNCKIVDSVSYILAFWDGVSSGTRNTLIDALKKDKQVKIVYIEDALKVLL